MGPAGEGGGGRSVTFGSRQSEASDKYLLSTYSAPSSRAGPRANKGAVEVSGSQGPSHRAPEQRKGGPIPSGLRLHLRREGEDRSTGPTGRLFCLQQSITFTELHLRTHHRSRNCSL